MGRYSNDDFVARVGNAGILKELSDEWKIAEYGNFLNRPGVLVLNEAPDDDGLSVMQPNRRCRVTCLNVRHTRRSVHTGYRINGWMEAHRNIVSVIDDRRNIERYAGLK